MLFFYIKSIRDFHGINAAKAAEGDALIDVVHFDAVRDVVFHQNVEDTLFFSRGGYHIFSAFFNFEDIDIYR